MLKTVQQKGITRIQVMSYCFFSAYTLKHRNQSPTIIHSRGQETFEESLGRRRGLLGLGNILLLQAFLLEDFSPAQGLGVRVETEKDSLVDERVLLLSPGAFLDFLASRSDNGLDFIAVDQTSNIRVRNLSSGEDVIFLVERGFLKGSKDFIKKSESVLSPDDESTEMTTRGELK